MVYTEVIRVTAFILAFSAGGLALLFALILVRRVMKEDQGTDKMRAIGVAIQEGSNAFLRREYRILGIFVLIIFVILAVIPDIGWRTAISYLGGAVGSLIAGFIGMTIAVRGNTRSAAAAMKGLNPALRVAFSTGAVMGFTVVGIGILSIAILYVVFKDVTVIAGVSFGASTVALFARVGGGIFTKAADVGADLAGKMEAGIPEDDPRNPAVIADNVGDNVGDVAGMGADLFESYVGSIVATLALAAAAASLGAAKAWNDALFTLPLVVAAGGILAAILGTFLVRANEQATFSSLLWALRRGIFFSSGLVLILSLVIVQVMDVDMKIFWSIVTGLGAGVIIGLATEYYTSYDYRPTKDIANAALTGPATTIIHGFSSGMFSTVVPLLVIGGAILLTFHLAGFYGVAIAAVGMLSTLGITLATDAYGPVADNAGGIAEQAHLDPEVRKRTDALDSLGNTTAATGKGFAIGSAALTSLALMAAYAAVMEARGITLVVSLLDHTTLVGLFFGAGMPFLFSALTMKAVGRAANAMVNEVRRQFAEIPGLREGAEDARADYARCVDISTQGALREMIVPGILAVVAPIIVGFAMGPQALGGFLIGSIAAGFLLAVTMANAGGAWDNAKKYVELGNLGGKGSEPHKATVVGDTVGDPFKDTSGPSLNILLKLMAIVALVFAPIFI
jgi:K(+)-stimulated pyrophosphate-energized sodium pump